MIQNDQARVAGIWEYNRFIEVEPVKMCSHSFMSVFMAVREDAVALQFVAGSLYMQFS